MKRGQELEVAVLLATYNGAQFVDSQIQSLKNNRTSFILHWLDDYSEDNTRAAVRSAARNGNIQLREWHQPDKLGWPATYFQLLELVDADIYLLCDQDDIWQPGKIDATVEGLQPYLKTPTLCFSDPLLFHNDNPSVCHPLMSGWGIGPTQTTQGTRGLVFAFSYGHTVGFTRELRDVVREHTHIARAYAGAHDMWLYSIAYAIGTIRFLRDVPTSLYRIHGKNTSSPPKCFQHKGMRCFLSKCRFFQSKRTLFAKQALGFVKAAALFPSGRNLDRMLEIANLLAQLERRQSLMNVLNMFRLRCLPPRLDLATAFATACLFSDASSANH